MTVDVEDYFQVSAFERHIPRSHWEMLPSRVERNTQRVLDLFEQHDVQATFFVLGWIAKRHPSLVREMVDRGHEVASHGYAHVRATRQKREAFREDVRRTKGLLEDRTGQPVNGYRAASFSIGEGNLWAIDVLAETGHLYSSSIYPVTHDLYGMPSAPRFAFRHRRAGLLELPLTTVSLLSWNMPCSGGGYFRLYPYRLSRWALSRVNRKEGQPAIFYFHPWEIDPDQPRQHGLSVRTRFRHYNNLHRMEARLTRLLKDFMWGRVDKVYQVNGQAFHAKQR